MQYLAPLLGYDHQLHRILVLFHILVDQELVTYWLAQAHVLYTLYVMKSTTLIVAKALTMCS